MPKICSVEGCSKNAIARGYCSTHYANWRRLGTPSPTKRTRGICTCQGCNKPIEGLGLCSAHYQRYKKYGSTGTDHLQSAISGLSKKYPSEYSSWKGAKERCLNPNSPLYPKYGGSGITFYIGWTGADGFKTFLRDMGPKPNYSKTKGGGGQNIV